RRAPGLRERHHREVPALPCGRHALDPRRGARPDHAGDPGEPRRVPLARSELQDYVNYIIEKYPRCRVAGTRWILVEALDQIMPEIPASLAEFASRELSSRTT